MRRISPSATTQARSSAPAIRALKKVAFTGEGPFPVDARISRRAGSALTAGFTSRDGPWPAGVRTDPFRQRPASSHVPRPFAKKNKSAAVSACAVGARVCEQMNAHASPCSMRLDKRNICRCVNHRDADNSAQTAFSRHARRALSTGSRVRLPARAVSQDDAREHDGEEHRPRSGILQPLADSRMLNPA